MLLWPHRPKHNSEKQQSDDDTSLCALPVQSLHRLTCFEGWHRPSVCPHWLTAGPARSSWLPSRLHNQEPWMHSVWACRETDKTFLKSQSTGLLYLSTYQLMPLQYWQLKLHDDGLLFIIQSNFKLTISLLIMNRKAILMHFVDTPFLQNIWFLY